MSIPSSECVLCFGALPPKSQAREVFLPLVRFWDSAGLGEGASGFKISVLKQPKMPTQHFDMPRSKITCSERILNLPSAPFYPFRGCRVQWKASQWHTKSLSFPSPTNVLKLMAWSFAIFFICLPLVSVFLVFLSLCFFLLCITAKRFCDPNSLHHLLTWKIPCFCDVDVLSDVWLYFHVVSLENNHWDEFSSKGSLFIIRLVNQKCVRRRQVRRRVSMLIETVSRRLPQRMTGI